MDRVMPAVNLQKWIAEHRHLLKPPTGNKMVWEDADFIIMVVGSNTRKDFHVNEGEEFFHQIEGDITMSRRKVCGYKIPIARVTRPPREDPPNPVNSGSGLVRYFRSM